MLRKKFYNIEICFFIPPPPPAPFEQLNCRNYTEKCKQHVCFGKLNVLLVWYTYDIYCCCCSTLLGAQCVLDIHQAEALLFAEKALNRKRMS